MVLHDIIIKIHIYDVLEGIHKKFDLKKSWRIVVALGSTAILALGTAQVAQFYLLSGAYFWFVYLSFGLYLLVFLLPWLNLLLPYQKNLKSKSMFFFNMSTGTVLLWIIVLINSPAIIYLDEGSVNSRPANVPLKFVTIGLLIIYYILSLIFMILANHIYILDEERTVVSLYRIVKDIKILKVSNWTKGGLGYQKSAVVISIIPTIFLLLVLSIENLVKYDSIMHFIDNILLFATIITIVGGLISLLFLGNHNKWIKLTSLIAYTVVVLFNLMITFMYTQSGFTLLFEMIGEGLHYVPLYLIAIKRIVVLLLNSLACIVPYVLLYRKKKKSVD
ncbi:hypothetical protein JZO83_13800 [Enterococcus sp. DIV1298c]|uniref:Uncharacterized protein n=1 Tax=Candidatus Enterococcus mangumiae TaxID=2230878 RepID=A0ABZ2SY33_9ENTE|nr:MULTISPECIES: hypothetical protein [unclassified Enterococcus]MBO0462812.1 hypothetical protein [Enterococcus sp. DIV1298c]MBO0491435.1 hypothetical protein [Enterococcus sp. DIV1094]